MIGVAAFIWVVIGAPGLEAITPAPDPIAAEQAEKRERSVYYPGCDAVRAAGLDPLYAGQPGYREEMDGDGDGVACEPYRRF